MASVPRRQLVMRWAITLPSKSHPVGTRLRTVSGGWSAKWVASKGLTNHSPCAELNATLL
jgi:hypothetical protein